MGNYDFSGLSASVRQIKPMLKRSRVRSQEDPEEWAGGSGPGSLCWPGSNAKGNKVGTCKTSSWQGLALAEGTTCGQPLPPALGGGKTGLVPGPVEKPSRVPRSSATCLVFCSACRKEPRSLLHCTTPGPSAQAVAAGGTTW